MKHSWRDQHVVVTIKSFSKILYFTAATFLSFYVLFHIGSSFYLSQLSEKGITDFKKGITQDTTYLKEQGDIVSRKRDLITELISHNHDHVVDILQKEKTDRHIGTIGLADGSGTIVGRTLNSRKFGDNVFLSVPAGRVVQKGESVQSIESTGYRNQMFMTTARPVLLGDTMVGALFANYLLDDEYAKSFSKKYLAQGDQVVFYTKNFGVYGDSFTDHDTRLLIDSYFNTGSDWVVNGITGVTVVVGGNTYLVENIVFPGLEKSPGGALIFIQRGDTAHLANIITATFTLCAFIFFAMRKHVRTADDEKGWRYYTLLGVVASLVFVFTYFLFTLQNTGRVHIEHIPYKIYNSTLSLDPESGIYDIGFDQHFSIVVNTGEEAINVVQVALKFDPAAVDMKSIDVASSTCPLVVENSIDHVAGTASLICGMVDSESKAQSIVIADITAKPLRPGSFTLSFDTENTKVLAQDGLGTNVLRMSQDSTYRADNFDFSLASSTASTSARSFVVFSPSHSNASRWYNYKNADFFWRGSPGAVYRYAFDTSPGTIPTDSHILKTNKISIQIPGDGVYYFHLQLASGGPVAHYQIRSDRTAPTITMMGLSQDKIVAGDVVRFLFTAEDASSDLQHNYYVDLGDHIYLPVGQDLFVPFLEAGEKSIVLRVYDNAGNYTEDTKTVHVE